MSLVAYESSSESESEESIPNNAGEVKLNGCINAHGSVTSSNGTTSNTNLFTALPQPTTALQPTEDIEEEQDEFLNKRETQTEKPKKQPIKIGIPSLSQFESDEDEPVEKKAKTQLKASGLFAILPPPKGTAPSSKQFVPNVLRNMNKKTTQTQKQTQAKAKKPKPTVTDKANEQPAELESDDDDNDIEIPETFDDDTWQKVCGRRKRVVKPILDQQRNPQLIEIAPEAVKPYDGLDNQAFKELMGASSKRKVDDINIIDINEDEILPDKDVWMMKSLTDPEMEPKYVVDDPVNDTCKRKHHITYLAQQAKANEQELKNQWAQNKFTRQKTQAKYGF